MDQILWSRGVLIGQDGASQRLSSSSSSQFRELHYLVMKGTNATDRPLTVHLLASRLPHPRQARHHAHSLTTSTPVTLSRQSYLVFAPASGLPPVLPSFCTTYLQLTASDRSPAEVKLSSFATFTYNPNDWILIQILSSREVMRARERICTTLLPPFTTTTST